MADDHHLRDPRLGPLFERALRAQSLSRRTFLQTAALAASASGLAARGWAAEPDTIACGDAAPGTLAPGCASDRIILKPTPADRFEMLGAGSAQMRWDRLNPKELLVPTKDFYVHNRSCPPPFDPATWRLTVEGDGIRRPLVLTYDQLTAMSQQRVVRVLDCAANGRAFFANDHYKNPPTPFAPNPAVSWRLGACGAAEWTGVALSDVLERASLFRSAREGLWAKSVLVESVEKVNGVNVGRVVPISKAMASDTLLVLGMNGEPLTPDHGAPVRVLFSGWAGIANVKWVSRIVVATIPLYSRWNAHHAVLIGPAYAGWQAFQEESGSEEGERKQHAWGPEVTDQNVKSAFELAWGARLPRGKQVLHGRSWSGISQIKEVNVSVDGGQTFRPARLLDPNFSLCWVRWELDWDAQPGEHLLVACAKDTVGRSQIQPVKPEQMPAFNKFGLMFGDRPGATDSFNAVPHPVTVV
jgi:sulfane dehydrogenase subunit SoxC